MMIAGLCFALFYGPSLPLALFLLSCLYISRLKAEVATVSGQLQKAESDEKQLRQELQTAKEEKAALETGLKAVLAACPDFFGVYSPTTLVPPSFAFKDLSSTSSTYWTDRLDPQDYAEFHQKAQLAASGEVVTMRIRLQRPTAHILPLSPLLEAVQEDKEAMMEVDMRPVVWGGPAVLIHMKPMHKDASVLDFMKMFNHEFRTPLNIIIGLSDLMMSDLQGDRETFMKRQRLLRLCASVLLAIINGLIHQCELTWKLPTGLKHTAFHLAKEMDSIVLTIKDKLLLRGNSLELCIETELPEVLWGNVFHLRRFLCYLLATCSNFTTHDKLVLKVRFTPKREMCTVDCELEAHCPALCSFAEFHSVLELLSDSEGLESEQYTARLQQADRQSLLHLSVAREMARLLFGDLVVVECDHLMLRFGMTFSLRKDFVLKRKGQMALDEEEFISMDSPMYAKEVSETEDLGDLTPSPAHHYITHYFSDAAIGFSFPSESRASRRSYTCPNRQLSFGQLPFNSGDITDVSDSPGHDCDPRQVTALVADDVPSNAFVLRDMLKHLGVSCALVSNGVEAVDFVVSRKLDVIFMDCEMPVMGGLEATKVIRGMRITVPIVAVTANGPEQAAGCKAAGMNYFISKPVRMSVLASLLEQLHLLKPM